MQVAVSMDKHIIGRHLLEKDILYFKVPEPDVRIFQTTYADQLTQEEQDALKEYVVAMRKKSPFFAF
jgi:acyl CoA:acetate/3-ketoacid CoA transferase